MKRAWNLAPLLQIIQKIPENCCPGLYLSIGQVWCWLNELWFKRYIKKCTLSHELILIMTSQILLIVEWFKIQKLDYLENGLERHNNKILNLYLRRQFLRSCFEAEVTFKLWTHTVLWSYVFIVNFNTYGTLSLCFIVNCEHILYLILCFYS